MQKSSGQVVTASQLASKAEESSDGPPSMDEDSMDSFE
jgi:hypothetical protein